jgi:hypothetical protein
MRATPVGGGYRYSGPRLDQTTGCTTAINSRTAHRILHPSHQFRADPISRRHWYNPTATPEPKMATRRSNTIARITFRFPHQASSQTTRHRPGPHQRLAARASSVVGRALGIGAGIAPGDTMPSGGDVPSRHAACGRLHGPLERCRGRGGLRSRPIYLGRRIHP